MTVAADLGVDLQAHWPTEGHFTSWLNPSPKRDISGGKVIRHIREKSGNRVAGVLRMAATSLLRSDSFLGARYRHLRTRLGAPKAIKATARYLACLIYRFFTRGQQWVDRGIRNFEIKRQQREIPALERKPFRSAFALSLFPTRPPQHIGHSKRSFWRVAFDQRLREPASTKSPGPSRKL